MSFLYYNILIRRYVEPIFEEDKDNPQESEDQYIPAVLTKALRERRRESEITNTNHDDDTNQGYGTFVDNLVTLGQE